MASSLLSADRPKKRYRHSPAQLLALNQLYDQNDHPSLESRTALAERLGMETKTVNSWFQNKRAAVAKKKGPARSTHDVPPITTRSSSSSENNPSHLMEDFVEHSPRDYGGPVLFDHKVPIPVRLSSDQHNELKRQFDLNPSPSPHEKAFLAERIGLSYQAIADWFDEERASIRHKPYDRDMDTTIHSESLRIKDLPPASNHPSLSSFVKRHRSPSVSLHTLDDSSSRRRRSSTPYGTATASRSRRSRPEPYQLDALKDLYDKTPTPSIEERTSLALEIGMDVTKVTNWFRNVRQSTRKRAKKADSDIELDDEPYISRPGSPSLPSSSSSSSSSINNDPVDYDHYNYNAHSSEDEYPEAVTPSPYPSPRLQKRKLERPGASMPRSTLAMESLSLAVDPSLYPGHDQDQIAVAHFLIDFHQHVVHAH